MPEPTLIDRLRLLTPKVDSPTRLAYFEQFGKEHYADAEYLNLLLEAAIYVAENGGGGSGTTRSVDGVAAGPDGNIALGALRGTRASASETQITVQVVEDDKFVSRLQLFLWSGSNSFMTKVRAVTLTSISFAVASAVVPSDTLIFAIGKLQAQINNKAIATDFAATPTDAIKLLTIKSVIDWKNILTFWRSTAFSGNGNRMLVSDSVGQVTATVRVSETNRRTDSNDVISVAIAATYNSANNFTAVIVPTNSRVFLEGQYFFNGGYKYEAVSENTVFRTRGA